MELLIAAPALHPYHLVVGQLLALQLCRRQGASHQLRLPPHEAFVQTPTHARYQLAQAQFLAAVHRQLHPGIGCRLLAEQSAQRLSRQDLLHSASEQRQTHASGLADTVKYATL